MRKASASWRLSIRHFSPVILPVLGQNIPPISMLALPFHPKPPLGRRESGQKISQRNQGDTSTTAASTRGYALNECSTKVNRTEGRAAGSYSSARDSSEKEEEKKMDEMGETETLWRSIPASQSRKSTYFLQGKSERTNFSIFRSFVGSVYLWITGPGSSLRSSPSPQVPKTTRDTWWSVLKNTAAWPERTWDAQQVPRGEQEIRRTEWVNQVVCIQLMVSVACCTETVIYCHATAVEFS
jgi:hypothetical protein